MAMRNPDLSGAHFAPRKTLSKPLYSISILHKLSLASSFSNARLLIIYSSKTPAPLLEDASNDLQTVLRHPIESPNEQPTTLPGLNISNEFIQGLCKTPQTEPLALEYYHKAKRRPGFRPEQKTLKLLIRGLVRSQHWSLIPALVEDSRVFDVLPDGPSLARLIGSCIRARKFKLAESLLGFLAAKKDVATPSFTSALRSYNRLHMFRSTVMVYDRMREAGLLLDDAGYYYAMDAYRNLGNTEKVVGLFLEFHSKEWDSKDFYARIYLILCDSLGKSGRAAEALRYFREMVSEGIQPNPSLYALLIGSFAGIREVDIAEDLFLEARQKGMIKDPALFQRLVIMYVDSGLIEKTLWVVKAMGEIGIPVSDCILCTVVNGYVRKRGLRASLRVYEQLLSLGCKPGQVTYASMVKVYCSLGRPKSAEAVFQEMIEKGYDKCLVAYSNMISMYGRVARVKDAMRLLAKMKETGCDPNVWVYNSLLDMHGRLMNLRHVEKLWKEMERRNVTPDKISYTSIICAYSKAREFEECTRLYREFRVKKGKVDRALAGVMVGVFSKSSRINELLNLLQELKSERTGLDERLYKSALNALRDAGLQAQVRWFEQSFSFEKDKT